ncbi:MAG: hypothetical protein MUO82_10730 [Candidatus Thermoplasmatota archaeon]|nr:hypothetical protein [Candidatus Thermoplasmatota archaeon]
MNAYDKLKIVKKDLINYNYELMKYLNNGASDISIRKVQIKILNLLREIE